MPVMPAVGGPGTGKIFASRQKFRIQSFLSPLISRDPLGSSTLNNGMFPTMGDFLTYMKGLKPKGKVFGLFGSHGWGGGAIKEIRKFLEQEKVEIWEKELAVQFVPDPEELNNAIQFGEEFARQIK